MHPNSNKRCTSNQLVIFSALFKCMYLFKTITYPLYTFYIHNIISLYYNLSRLIAGYRGPSRVIAGYLSHRIYPIQSHPFNRTHSIAPIQSHPFNRSHLFDRSHYSHCSHCNHCSHCSHCNHYCHYSLFRWDRLNGRDWMGAIEWDWMGVIK